MVYVKFRSYLDICHDMEELCPDAWLLSYANPMAIICWAVNDYTRIKNVGLCHSVENTANELARYLGIPYKDLEVPEGAIFDHFASRPHDEFKEISHWVAGLNHMAWFLEFKWRGQDAYPLLRERFKDPLFILGLMHTGPARTSSAWNSLRLSDTTLLRQVGSQQTLFHTSTKRTGPKFLRN